MHSVIEPASMKIRDTTYYLWDVTFRCKTPYLQTTDIEYIKHFGMHTTTHMDIDRVLANQWIDTMLPIVKMVEYHQKGIPFRIVKDKDVKTVYEYIENHLQAWANAPKLSLNFTDIPVDDLIAMNEFANTLFPLVKQKYADENIKNASVAFYRFLDVNGMGRFAGLKKHQTIEQTKQESIPQREDLFSFFKSIAQRKAQGPGLNNGIRNIPN